MKLTPFPWIVFALAVTAAPAFAQDGAEQSMSLFQMFFWSGDLLGIVIIWLLLLMSVFSIGFSIKVFIDYRKTTLLPQPLHDQISTMLEEKRYREAIDASDADPSYLAKLLRSALGEASNGFGAMERAVEEAGDAETTRMLRPVEYLNVLGNISPMIGLFGTVYGMIRAFQVLVEKGGKPDPAELAAGISTALVTTFWGLVVAIPALAVYAVIRNKIDALTAEGMLQTEELIRPFKPGTRKQAGSSGRPRATPQPDAEK
jgi:biopolymer transport protein ExbB